MPYKLLKIKIMTQVWQGSVGWEVLSENNNQKVLFDFLGWVLSGVRAPPVYSCVSPINSSKYPKIACNDRKNDLKRLFLDGENCPKNLKKCFFLFFGVGVLFFVESH